jgi:hypothetical protein
MGFVSGNRYLTACPLIARRSLGVCTVCWTVPYRVIAVGEGSIDRAAGALSMGYYSCHVEHRPSLIADEMG